MANKRNAQRCPVEWGVTFQQEGAMMVGKLADLSSTGVRFTLPVALRIGATIMLDIAPKGTTFFRCTVRLMREQRAANGERTYGARFLEMSVQDKEILRRALLEFTEARASSRAA